MRPRTLLALLLAVAGAAVAEDPPPASSGSSIDGGGKSLGGKGVGQGEKDKLPGGGSSGSSASSSGGGAPESVDSLDKADSCDGRPARGRTSFGEESRRLEGRVLVGEDDAIDLRKVIYAKGASIADWKITSRIQDVKVGGGSICIEHTAAHKGVSTEEWPTSDFFGDKGTQVEGNQWVFAFIRGRWYGGAGEWIRPGQTCKAVNAGNVGCGVFYDSEPLKSWVPKRGEMVGLAVSQPARAGQWSKPERSNVVLVPWP